MVGRSGMDRASKVIRHSSASHLPDEVLFDEILMGIPLLCLVRLRTVCKSWCSILSSPTFMSAYHKRHHSTNTDVIEFYTNHSQIHNYNYNYHNDTIVNQITKLDLPAMLVSTDTDTPSTPNNNKKNKHNHYLKSSRFHLKKKTTPVLRKTTVYSVVGYCDGIMCFLLPLPNLTVDDPYTEQILLWDLTLGKTTLTLPSSYNYFTYGIHNHREIIYGFGYDDKTSHDYKVLRASIFPGGDESRETVVVQANVYSLRLNTWRSFEATLPCVNPRDMRGVHVNGVLYWLNDDRSVFTFCLADQVFDHIPLAQDMSKPDEHHPYNSISHVLISLEMGGEDKLGLFTRRTHPRISASVALWVRLDDWTKLYDIDLGIPLQSHRFINHQYVMAKSDNAGQWLGYDSRTLKKVSVNIKDNEEVDDDPCRYRSSLSY